MNLAMNTYMSMITGFVFGGVLRPQRVGLRTEYGNSLDFSIILKKKKKSNAKLPISSTIRTRRNQKRKRNDTRLASILLFNLTLSATFSINLPIHKRITSTKHRLENFQFKHLTPWLRHHNRLRFEPIVRL